MGRRRRHSREFKLFALERMVGEADVAGLALELGLAKSLLYKWQRAFACGGAAALRQPGERMPAAEAAAAALSAPGPAAGVGGTTASQIAALERKVAQQALELDFFRAALQHFEERRGRTGGSGGTGFTP